MILGTQVVHVDLLLVGDGTLASPKLSVELAFAATHA